MSQKVPKYQNYIHKNIIIPVTSVLTVNSCAQIVIEIIKFLAYQRIQIPYNYDHLKYVVNKKRQKIDPLISNESASSRKYYRLTSLALDTLDAIFKNIIHEFNSEDLPEQICIAIGSNIICAKEVYYIQVPSTLKSHYECNHSCNSESTMRKILRGIAFSDDMKFISNVSLLPTNMYVFMKKKKKLITNDSSFFLPIDVLRVPQKAHKVTINLDYNPTTNNCCSVLKVFDDFSLNFRDSLNLNDVNSSHEIISNKLQYSNNNKNENWFQAHVFLKGFKAMFLNGESLSNMW